MNPRRASHNPMSRPTQWLSLQQARTSLEDNNAGVLLSVDFGAPSLYGHNMERLPKFQKRKSTLGQTSLPQVSTDILRVSGYSRQFGNLLSNTSQGRRPSEPESTSPGDDLKLDSRGHRCNGSVEMVAQGETGGAVVKTITFVETNHEEKSTTKLFTRNNSGYAASIITDSQAKMRTRIRKQLFKKRIAMADVSFVLAMVGIALVIVDTELTALDLGIDKDHSASLVIRLAACCSTVLLMIFVGMYHAVEIKLALIDSGAEDWRVAVTTERIVKLLAELCVCAICPFPGTGYIWWPYLRGVAHSDEAMTLVRVPLDVLLSVPMFLRVYLVARFMVLHSRQFQDAATRSIAALNRISMDFRFVMKTMMSEHPLRVLIVVTLCYWICMSWMFTQCERYDENGASAHTYLNSIWFIMVTFMSIGYGDIVPMTYCGRTLSITTGIVGAGVSSALIAVMSRKLELSRAEKHVNNFMSDSKLTHQRKNAAACVLQETWFIHKYKTSGRGKVDDLRVRTHQRKFLAAITNFRRIKWDQRKLAERGNSLLDVGKMHSEMHETLWDMHKTQETLIAQVDGLTQKVLELHAMLSNKSMTTPPSTPKDRLEDTPSSSSVIRPTSLVA